MGETQKKEKKKIGLTTKIFIALLAGAVFGIILCYAVPSGHIKDDIIVEGVLYVVGQGFIKLMKMLVVPLVFCSLVCGSMSRCRHSPNVPETLINQGFQGFLHSECLITFDYLFDYSIA